MGLVPAVRRFESDAAAKLERRGELPSVFEIGGAHETMPVERCGIGNDSEGLDGSLQESRERGEGGLAILVLGKVIVRLERLEPHACLEFGGASESKRRGRPTCRDFASSHCWIRHWRRLL